MYSGSELMLSSMAMLTIYSILCWGFLKFASYMTENPFGKHIINREIENYSLFNFHRNLVLYLVDDVHYIVMVIYIHSSRSVKLALMIIY